ncbi:MAG: heme o synthase [Acidimicrobiia bacterium]
MTDTMSPSGLDQVKAYVELTKPRIVELLLVTTIPAMAVAAQGWPGLWPILYALIGGTLSAGGANVINQVYDDDIDQVMARTSGRPLPTDRVSKRAAVVFGIGLGVAGFVVLWIGTTLLAAVLSVVAYLLYVLVYTMLLKRSTTQNIVLGGAAGAIPPLIGYAAVAGTLSSAAWVMFAIVFFWTPSHFWALSLKYEDDYRAASIPMLSVVAGEGPTLSQILWYAVATAGVSLLLVPAAGMGAIYAVVAVVSASALVVFAVRLVSDQGSAMKYFGITNVYLALVFLAMLVDRVVLDSAVGGAELWTTVGSVLVAGSLVMIVLQESKPGMRAEGVSPVRHVVEVGITVVFAVALVISVWMVVL